MNSHPCHPPPLYLPLVFIIVTRTVDCQFHQWQAHVGGEVKEHVVYYAVNRNGVTRVKIETAVSLL